jgi:hypothetical protein
MVGKQLCISGLQEIFRRAVRLHEKQFSPGVNFASSVREDHDSLTAL